MNRWEIAENAKIELRNVVMDKIGKKYNLTAEQIADTKRESEWRNELLDIVTDWIDNYLKEYGVVEPDFPIVKCGVIGNPYKDNKIHRNAVYFRSDFEEDVMIDSSMWGYGCRDLHNAICDYLPTLMLDKDWYDYDFEEHNKWIVERLAKESEKYFGDGNVVTKVKVTEYDCWIHLSIIVPPHAPGFIRDNVASIKEWLEDRTDWTTIKVNQNHGELTMRFPRFMSHYEWFLNDYGRNDN